MTERESRVQYWKGSVLVTRAIASCPSCGGDEWDMKEPSLNYDMSIYVCTKCGKVVKR